jgi:uncharacterized protein (TIGR02246 family)
MRSPSAPRRTRVVGTATLCFSLLGLAAGAVSAADPKPADKSDEAAILATVDSYTAAYNKGDARGVAAHWSERGVWSAGDGRKFQGVAAIEKELKELFAAQKGTTIEVVAPSVRLVTADVAVEEGTARVARPNEPASESTYVAIHVKQGGKWKLDSVHETEVAAPAAVAESPLQELAWLVGQWVDADSKTAAEANVAWTKNRTFLNYSFRAAAPGLDDLEGTQVVGYDAATGTIRSWMFDSDGGFGEGAWTPKDGGWVVRFRQTLPDGRTASSTNIYTRVDDDTWTWRSIGRKLDGEFLPNTEEVTMRRKPAPKAEAAPPATTVTPRAEVKSPADAKPKIPAKPNVESKPSPTKPAPVTKPAKQ